MAQRSIEALAFIKVNWDLKRHDYLETLIPLVQECLRDTVADPVSATDIRNALRNKFGLNFPASVVSALLSRARKRGLLVQKNHAYYRNREALADDRFAAARAAASEAYSSTISALQSFAVEQGEPALDDEAAENAVELYLRHNRQHALTSLSSNGDGGESKARSGRTYLVASFVDYLATTNSPILEQLLVVVQGDMIANALFLPEAATVPRNFRNTEVYFDTSFLIYALGYAGDVRREPCVDLLDLLYESNADLRCFSHTLDEVRGILEACARKIAQNDLRYAFGPTIEYLIQANLTSSDIELLATRVETALKALRIHVVPPPTYTDESGIIDEAKLEAELQEGIGYSNKRALQRDVDSVAAVVRIRAGRDMSAIEDCGALLVTTNSGLVRLAKAHLRKEDFATTVPPCVTDSALTTLLWLKKPSSAPQLPRKRLLADSYAILQPDNFFWDKYLREIDKLEKDGTITNQDYYLLRHSFVAKSALMDFTKGNPDAFTHGTPLEILEQVKNEIQRDLLRQLDQAHAHNEDEARKRSAKEREIQLLHENFERIARESASVQVRRIELAVLFILVSLFSFTVPWHLPPFRDAYVRYISAAVQLGFGVLGVIDAMRGGMLAIFLRQLEVRWERAYLARLLSNKSS